MIPEAVFTECERENGRGCATAAPPIHRPEVLRAPGSEGWGGWHKPSVFSCLPSAAPIGLSPLYIPTLCGSEHVLVVSTEPLDDLSCLTTPGVGRPRDGLLPVPGGGGLDMVWSPPEPLLPLQPSNTAQRIPWGPRKRPICCPCHGTCRDLFSSALTDPGLGTDISQPWPPWTPPCPSCTPCTLPRCTGGHVASRRGSHARSAPAQIRCVGQHRPRAVHNR